MSLPAAEVAFALPGDDRRRLDNPQGGSPVSPDFPQPSPEESIGGGQFRPLDPAIEDAESMTEGEHLNLQSRTASE